MTVNAEPSRPARRRICADTASRPRISLRSVELLVTEHAIARAAARRLVQRLRILGPGRRALLGIVDDKRLHRNLHITSRLLRLRMQPDRAAQIMGAVMTCVWPTLASGRSACKNSQIPEAPDYSWNAVPFTEHRRSPPVRALRVVARSQRPITTPPPPMPTAVFFPFASKTYFSAAAAPARTLQKN